MENNLIKNNKQLYFNQIKGTIIEINKDENFSNIVVSVGHDNVRNICFVIKTDKFSAFENKFQINDKVAVKYYLSSRKKHDRWYTTATILDVTND
jgi:hypothetical protein